MKHRKRLGIFVISATLLVATAAFADGPVKVELKHADDGWTLLRGDEPYFIKGAGGDGSKPLLVQDGGNSFRTWGTDKLGEKLDEAQKLGLTVCAGIWMKHEAKDFSYSNPKQVADQLALAKAAVEKYRNHPALLMWAVGNEMEGYKAGDNPKIWQAVEDTAAMIKKLDPNHPTLTVIAEVGGARVSSINDICKDIDLVGINSYGGVGSVGERYKKAGGTKPYVITEFGPPGTWELHRNKFGQASEPTSTKKGDIYRSGYAKGVLAEKGLCLGSYVFTWGHKQEATATWYGLFLADGAQLEAVHTMAELWSGKAPANRCPQVEPIKLAKGAAVTGGQTVHVSTKVVDPDNDPLTVKWVLSEEVKHESEGGDVQPTPPVVDDAILHGDTDGAEVKMPTEPGNYRLYVYAYDNHGNAATANLPLHVGGTQHAARD